MLLCGGDGVDIKAAMDQTVSKSPKKKQLYQPPSRPQHGGDEYILDEFDEDVPDDIMASFCA